TRLTSGHASFVRRTSSSTEQRGACRDAIREHPDARQRRHYRGVVEWKTHPRRSPARRAWLRRLSRPGQGPVLSQAEKRHGSTPNSTWRQWKRSTEWGSSTRRSRGTMQLHRGLAAAGELGIAFAAAGAAMLSNHGQAILGTSKQG